jgi:NTE family protein
MWNHGPSFQRARKHRLALVLGSGGVRSIAAQGIADRLAREGIRPDLIVGCSSGALFGAQIARGMQGQTAVSMATTLWSAELTQKRRWMAYLQVVAPKLSGFENGFALRDDRLIAARMVEAFGDSRLEHLPTPLRVVSTDAMTGKAVVLTLGLVVDALRASMAVPIIFPSVCMEGRQLVDGVLSDPLPIGVAADAGVVVSLGFQGSMPRRVDRLSRLVAQTSTTLINNLMEARVQAAKAAGQKVIDIELDLDRHVGLWETAAMPYLYEVGWRAAETRLLDIAAAWEQAQPPLEPSSRSAFVD